MASCEDGYVDEEAEGFRIIFTHMQAHEVIVTIMSV
jgi:hypothetical protein